MDQLRDELIRLLQERAGLDQEQAERAAAVAIDFVRERGPDVARAILGGGENTPFGGLGGLFGR
jgi:hypothetical protein